MTNSRRETFCLLLGPVPLLDLEMLDLISNLFGMVIDEYHDRLFTFVILLLHFDAKKLVSKDLAICCLINSLRIPLRLGLLFWVDPWCATGTRL